MTSLAQSRMHLVLALSIPAAGFVYLTSSSSLMTKPSTVGVMLGVAALCLAAVASLSTLRNGRGDRAERVMHGPTGDLVPPRAVMPAYVSDRSRALQQWRWTSVLLAPLELLALAWSVPVVILLIMLPIGLALSSALWLGRLILGRF